MSKIIPTCITQENLRFKKVKLLFLLLHIRYVSNVLIKQNKNNYEYFQCDSFLTIRKYIYTIRYESYNIINL